MGGPRKTLRGCRFADARQPPLRLLRDRARATAVTCCLAFFLQRQNDVFRGCRFADIRQPPLRLYAIGLAHSRKHFGIQTSHSPAVPFRYPFGYRYLKPAVTIRHAQESLSYPGFQSPVVRPKTAAASPIPLIKMKIGRDQHISESAPECTDVLRGLAHVKPHRSLWRT